MQYITIYDYLLLPVYLFVFYVIIKKKSVKYTDPDVRKLFVQAFGLRMLGAVLYSMVVQYYYGYGDSFTFFTGSNFFLNQIKNDFGNLQYFFAPGVEVSKWYVQETSDYYFSGFIGAEASLFVMKICAVLSVFTFNKFLITSLFFGLFSFAGQWRMFLVFKDINKGKNTKLLGYAVLYTPSIWFWGSGLMKDSICLGALGFIIHITYKMIVKKKFSLTDILLLVFMIYIVSNIKNYIIIIFAVSFAVVLFSKFLISIKNVLFRIVILFVFLVLSFLTIFISNLDQQLEQLADESQQQVKAFQNNYEATQQEDESSKAGVTAEEIDASVMGLIKHSPVAIFTCLFRPFIWESRKVFILLSALESTLLLIATLYLFYKNRFWGFFKLIFNNEYLIFAFTMSMLFALIIGFTTYNFGTIIRYKIMFMPFYYFILVQVHSLTKKSEIRTKQMQPVI